MAENLGGPPQTKKALILSGGAPNATLIAGALLRLHEEDVHFDVISVSGAGTFIGLFYLVPNGIDKVRDDQAKSDELRAAALKSSQETGVEDLLFRLLPVNFKVFHKPGRMAEAYRKITRPWVKLAHDSLTAAFDLIEPLRSPERTRERIRDWVAAVAKIEKFDEKRFAHDVIDLWHSLLSPMWLTPGSSGLCAHPPLLNDFVMIDQLQELDIEFYMNSFNLTKGKMQIFRKEEITSDHFYASLAYPFFYPPYRMPNGDYHIEGAAIDALNFKGLLQSSGFISSIVVIDVAGKRKLMHRPRGLSDALAQSIMTPLIEVARDDVKLFEKMMEENRRAFGFEAPVDARGHRQAPGLEGPVDARGQLDYYTQHPPEVLKLEIEMSKKEWQHSLEWAASNLETQFNVGYESAGKLLEEHPELRS